MNKIEQIASKHLGKAGDGSVVKPYETPDTIDASLLVGVPRELNRVAYGIENEQPGSIGYDVWNAFEVSTLLENGFPANFVVRIVYPSTSHSIVESKSIKLYFNSFNMHRFKETSVQRLANRIGARVADDLSPVLGVRPRVGVMLANWQIDHAQMPSLPYLETSIDHMSMTFDAVNEDPSILCAANGGLLRIQTSLLRSNCRVTHQPDWGDVIILMEGKETPTLESLAQYIVSMRKENHFHEEICECIYKRLHDRFQPEHLAVVCLYTRRGGIDINPVRHSSAEFFEKNFPDFLNINIIFKTNRQ